MTQTESPWEIAVEAARDVARKGPRFATAAQVTLQGAYHQPQVPAGTTYPLSEGLCSYTDAEVRSIALKCARGVRQRALLAGTLAHNGSGLNLVGKDARKRKQIEGSFKSSRDKLFVRVREQGVHIKPLPNKLLRIGPKRPTLQDLQEAKLEINALIEAHGRELRDLRDILRPETSEHSIYETEKGWFTVRPDGKLGEATHMGSSLPSAMKWLRSHRWDENKRRWRLAI